MDHNPKSVELKSGELGFKLTFGDPFFTFEIINSTNSLRGATSAIIIEEEDRLIPLYPFSGENWKVPVIQNKTDPFGEYSEIRVRCNFRPLNGNLDLYLPGIWYFKVYSKLSNLDTSHSPVNHVSVQIILEKEKILKKYWDIRIYGYSPLYMDDLGELHLNSTNEDPQNITFYSNGNQSWSLNFLLGYDDKWKSSPLSFVRYNMENQDYALKGRYQSELHSVISDKSSKNSLVLSFVTMKDQFSRVLMDRMGTGGNVRWLSAYSQTDSFPIRQLNPGLCQSEVLVLSLVNRPEQFEVLRGHCQMGGVLAGVKASKKIIAGWCSWYYYYTKINERQMLANLDFFDKRRDLPIELIQLDDGYQTCISDWGIDPPYVFNEKFPNGLKWLVDKIQDKGLNSGLWVAPFFTTKKSELFKTHPDWALRNQKGRVIKTTYNWNASQLGLDLSREDVIAHMKSIGSTVGKDWGFNFLKIDFLFASMAIGAQYKNNKYSRAQIIRRGVQAIRDGLGADRNLLGCGAPLGPCVGLTDIMRIGCDTAANWRTAENLSENIIRFAIPALKPALRATIQRSYMHNTYWINDPDCVVVRKNKSKLSMDEIILQLTVFGLSRGQVLISDDEILVEENRLDLLKRILPPSLHIPQNNEIDAFAAVPLDLFLTKEPTIYAKTIIIDEEKHHLAALLNWSEKSQSRNVCVSELIEYNQLVSYKNTQEFIVFDYWAEKIVGKFKLDEKIEGINVPKHGCKYFSITPLISERENVQLLCSTLHILQGVYEISEFESNITRSHIEMDLPGIHKGSIFLLHPNPELTRMEIESSGQCSHQIIKQKIGALIKIDVILDRNMILELKY